MNLPNKSTRANDRENIEQAIITLEAKRSMLGDQAVDLAIALMREKLTNLDVEARSSHEPQERKLVTVLFADVSGFTAMAESMDHEIVSSVINSLWSRVDKAIQDHGGRIDKHIGDAVMALFGTPSAHEDDPERAIRAALQIQSGIQDWKSEFAESSSTRQSQNQNIQQNIQLRIGINTGPALLGTVGTIGEYTAIGDTVNLAGWLERAAPIGGILISQDTHRHVRGLFEVTALEPINVKGKSKPVSVFVVNGIKPRSFRDTTRGLEDIETRTIGREKELAELKAAFEKTVDQRRTCLVTLVAEAGIGKSRVLFEFGKWLDVQQHPIHLFRGRAAQETSQIPYTLLRAILLSSFGIQDHDHAAIARQKLERGILEYTGNRDTANLYAHFIGHLIGLDYSTSPYLKGILEDARQIRGLAYHYATRLFADITRNQPAIIFLEDIHWADKDSLDFFDHVVNAQPNLPLLVIGLARSTLFEQQPGWGTGPIQNLRLNLPPLSEDDSRLLVAEILQKVPKVPDILADLIVKKAEGSPYYIEELIRVLIEGGVIVRGTEQWAVKTDRLPDLKIPTTLTGLLQARLDSLAPIIRETLQQASVVGRVFRTNIVENMRNPEPQYAEAPIPILDRLETLRAKELIFPEEESADSADAEALEFIFKNSILHDMTYESVLLRLRPIYHVQAAEGLIQLSGERASEYAGRVGEHYERAGERLQAADWYSRAGRKAQSTYASDAAISYYQKALDFYNEHSGPEHLQKKLEVRLRLGEVMNSEARYSEAIEIYNSMLKMAEENEELVAQSRALQGLATSLRYQGDHRASLDYAILAEELARSVNEKLELARTIWAQGSARYRLGESQAALSLAEQALTIFTDLNNQNEMARSLNLLGAAHYVSGRYEKAKDCWEHALRIFQELGNRQQVIDLLSNLGVIADARGDYDSAFQQYDRALAIAREIGYRHGEIVFLTNRGGEQVALKNYEAAEADLRQAIQMAGITGSSCLPLTFNYRAEALIGLGNYEEAYYSARQALVLGEADKMPEYIGMAWRTLGIFCDSINDVVHFSDSETHQMTEYDAQTCFNESIKVFEEAEIDAERARTLRAWARYELKRGNKEQGAKMWQEAQHIFARLGAQMEVDRMNELPA